MSGSREASSRSIARTDWSRNRAPAHMCSARFFSLRESVSDRFSAFFIADAEPPGGGGVLFNSATLTA